MKTFRQNLNHITKRIWNPLIYNYPLHFTNALNRSKRIDLQEYAKFEYKDFTFNEEQKAHIINDILTQLYEVNKYSIEDVALKCMFFSNELSKFLKDSYNLESYVTSGNVYVNKLRINYESLGSVYKRLRDKNYFPSIKFHCWLTLQNYDIIDITIVPNLFIEDLGRRTIAPDAYQKVLWINKGKFDKKGVVYKPTIIGYDYFNKIKLPLNIQFIAIPC